MLPQSMQKTAAVNYEVAKDAIAAAPFHIDIADDLKPVMLHAIMETEQSGRLAGT